jgi:hypothetical protein
MHRRVAFTTNITYQSRRIACSTSKSSKPKYVQATTPRDPAKPIPDDRIKPPDHGVPPGSHPSSALYKQFPEADQDTIDGMKDAANRPSSSASTPAHPATTQEGAGRAGSLKKDKDGVGWSSAVRHRSSPGEMSAGGEGGLGLMKDNYTPSKKPQ